MSILKLAVGVAFAALAGAAQAETFTFVNTTTGADQVTLPSARPDGRPAGASLNRTTTVATFADGRKAETSARCSSWILPPSSEFGSNGVCDYKDANGPLYQSRFTCNAPQPGGKGVDCWGSLLGVGGVWKGRTGAFTFHTEQNGNHGEGHWNE